MKRNILTAITAIIMLCLNCNVSMADDFRIANFIVNDKDGTSRSTYHRYIIKYSDGGYYVISGQTTQNSPHTFYHTYDPQTGVLIWAAVIDQGNASAITNKYVARAAQALSTRQRGQWDTSISHKDIQRAAEEQAMKVPTPSSRPEGYPSNFGWFEYYTIKLFRVPKEIGSHLSLVYEKAKNNSGKCERETIKNQGTGEPMSSDCKEFFIETGQLVSQIVNEKLESLNENHTLVTYLNHALDNPGILSSYSDNQIGKAEIRVLDKFRTPDIRNALKEDTQAAPSLTMDSVLDLYSSGNIVTAKTVTGKTIRQLMDERTVELAQDHLNQGFIGPLPNKRLWFADKASHSKAGSFLSDIDKGTAWKKFIVWGQVDFRWKKGDCACIAQTSWIQGKKVVSKDIVWCKGDKVYSSAKDTK